MIARFTLLRKFKTRVFFFLGLILAASVIGFVFAAGAPQPPTSLTVFYTRGATVVDVNLTWTVGFNSGADLYRIYKRYQGGEWTYLGQAEASSTRYYGGYLDYNLAAGPYEYRVIACNAMGCSPDSNIATASVDGDGTNNTPTYISNIHADITSVSSVQIKWTTDKPSDSELLWAHKAGGDGTPGGSWSIARERCDGGGFVTNHCINFTGLNPSTTYYYIVESKTPVVQFMAQSPAYNFTSAPSNWTTPLPIPSLIPPYIPPVQLLYPIGGECFNPGAPLTIRWSQSQTVDHVALYETQSGYGGLPPHGQWFYLSQRGETSFTGTVPPYNSSRMVVWVAALDENNHEYLGSSDDANKNYFTISQGCSGAQPLPSPVPSPAPGITPTPSPAPSPIAGSSVNGTVTTSAGQAVSGVLVHIYNENFHLSLSAVTPVDGSFHIDLPPGAYFAEIIPPFGRTDLVRPAPTQFTVASGETKTLALTFGSFVKSISGMVLFTSGTSVTDAEVGAYNEGSGQWASTITDAQGAFTMKVGPGKWHIGIRPVNPSVSLWQWNGSLQEVVFSSDTTSETHTVQFSVLAANSKVTVKVTDQNDSSVSDAGVILDTLSATEPPPIGPRIPPEFRKSNSAGIATFTVIPGKYHLRAYLPSELKFTNPEENVFEIGAGEEKTTNLVFKKLTAGGLVVAGTVKLDNGTAVDAFVWAWSEKGRAVSGVANADGTFSLPVSENDKWHIGAAKGFNNLPYKSSEIKLNVAQQSLAGVDLVLVGEARWDTTPVLQPASVTQSPGQPAVAQTHDGAEVVVPPQAVAATTTIQWQIAPTVEVPSQAAAQVVDKAYDVTAKDPQGKEVKELKEKVEIVIPYKEEDLKAQGIKEDSLVPSFFDESAGTWNKAEDYSIDKEKNVGIIRTKHLTRFALVAASDVVPPPPVNNVSAVKSGRHSVLLQWTNPVTDFHHVKIYRSTLKKRLGDVIAAEVKNAFSEDVGLQNGVRYYYAIRSVDPAGNEATNLDQVPAIVSTAAPLALKRNLSPGLKNDASVRTLQIMLFKLGYYSGPITGSFGPATKAAVIQFQTVTGIGIASGKIDTATRTKLNQIAAK